MSSLAPKQVARLKRQTRVRKKITGSPARPRLNVFKSARHIYAQLIDDSTGKTLAAQSKTIDQTHTLVNSKFTEAVDRIASLEAKLGLQPGETIPTAAITTAATKKAKP